MEVYENVEGVAKIISVSPSTVKKYYGLFEKEGYRFKRSNEGYLLFDELEIDMFKDLIFLKNQPNMNISMAVKEIVKREGITDISDTQDTTTVMSDISQQVMTIMSDMIELKQLVQEQSEIIKHQQKYIEEKLEDRDRKLIESLRESQEERKALLQIAAAQEEEKKIGFFARLFGK